MRKLWQRHAKGGILDGFKSCNQIAHPLDIEDIVEFGGVPYGLDLPRLERVPVPTDHPAKRYLEHRSHDAGMFDFSLESDRATLTLNDYDGWRLAGAYEQRLGRPIFKSMLLPRVPVQLEFVGLTEFRAYQYEFNGKLTRLKHSLRSNLEKAHSFDTDWVLQFDSRGIVLIIEVRVWPGRCTLVEKGDSRGVGNVWHAHNLLLCLGCKEIVVHERQRETWIEQFGEDKVWIWDAYEKVRGERAMPIWQDFVDYLEEIGA